MIASGGGSDGRGMAERSLGERRLSSGSIPPSSEKRGGMTKSSGKLNSNREMEKEGVIKGCCDSSSKG